MPSASVGRKYSSFGYGVVWPWSSCPSCWGGGGGRCIALRWERCSPQVSMLARHCLVLKPAGYIAMLHSSCIDRPHVQKVNPCIEQQQKLDGWFAICGKALWFSSENYDHSQRLLEPCETFKRLDLSLELWGTVSSTPTLTCVTSLEPQVWAEWKAEERYRGLGGRTGTDVLYGWF